MAPLLFVVFHAYLLLNLKLLADNVERYNELVRGAKHRVLLAIDIGVLWLFWPHVVLSKARRNLVSLGRVAALALGLLVIGFSTLIATFPGERMAKNRLADAKLIYARHERSNVVRYEYTSLHDWLFAGSTDEIMQRSTSRLSNKLVLNGWSPAASGLGAQANYQLNLRGRDLRGADLSRAHLEGSGRTP